MSRTKTDLQIRRLIERAFEAGLRAGNAKEKGNKDIDSGPYWDDCDLRQAFQALIVQLEFEMKLEAGENPLFGLTSRHESGTHCVRCGVWMLDRDIMVWDSKAEKGYHTGCWAEECAERKANELMGSDMSRYEVYVKGLEHGKAKQEPESGAPGEAAAAHREAFAKRGVPGDQTENDPSGLPADHRPDRSPRGDDLSGPGSPPPDRGTGDGGDGGVKRPRIGGYQPICSVKPTNPPKGGSGMPGINATPKPLWKLFVDQFVRAEKAVDEIIETFCLDPGKENKDKLMVILRGVILQPRDCGGMSKEPGESTENGPLWRDFLYVVLKKDQYKDALTAFIKHVDKYDGAPGAEGTIFLAEAFRDKFEPEHWKIFKEIEADCLREEEVDGA